MSNFMDNGMEIDNGNYKWDATNNPNPSYFEIGTVINVNNTTGLGTVSINNETLDFFNATLQLLTSGDRVIIGHLLDNPMLLSLGIVNFPTLGY